MLYSNKEVAWFVWDIDTSQVFLNLNQLHCFQWLWDLSNYLMKHMKLLLLLGSISLRGNADVEFWNKDRRIIWLAMFQMCWLGTEMFIL